MNAAFLILHFKHDDVTAKCIDGIINNMEKGDFHIIIVDNASNNGSLERLQDKYKEMDDVISFISNKKNLGYAKGNNIGFLYAKNVLHAEWIILLNNDVVVEQKNMLSILQEEYRDNPYYLLGPDIVNMEGVHQNPFRMRTPTFRSVISKLIHDIIVYLSIIFRIKTLLYRVGVRGQVKESEVDAPESIIRFHGVLHGSCLVFSPDYIKRFQGLYPGTFLYVEEDILCYLLNKYKLPYNYCSRITVKHMHATSMKRQEKDANKRKKQIVKWRIQSYLRCLFIILSHRNIEQLL